VIATIDGAGGVAPARLCGRWNWKRHAAARLALTGATAALAICLPARRACTHAEASADTDLAGATDVTLSFTAGQSRPAPGSCRRFGRRLTAVLRVYAELAHAHHDDDLFTCSAGARRPGARAPAGVPDRPDRRRGRAPAGSHRAGPSSRLLRVRPCRRRHRAGWSRGRQTGRDHHRWAAAHTDESRQCDRRFPSWHG
jgi:hypothetical protein